ncbi:DUF542 domain-containing protein [Calditerricola satsumensis]|uniref:Hemerythrin n=1 Tax=Calditerricola satsumensis TaxID=373054 RepID=A0A8J3FE04_9BACI|nr:DUF542 domain-containing protein [Calditerricola satsumensis]GGJ98243.1 hypothetical protein GCM10007043_10230 [Calditerricola satsumensis]
MRFTKDMTVNQVIQASPEAMKVLAAFGIDLCCGGMDTLEEAARKAGVAVEEVMEKLNATKGG